MVFLISSILEFIMRKELIGYDGDYIIDGLDIISVKFEKELKLKQGKDSNGYLMVTLCKNGKTKSYYVHRLIAEAYIPNPDNKPQVNHKNGNKTDNRIENLEWVTISENRQHAFDIGLQIKGEKHHLSKLKDSDIYEIFELRKQGLLLKEIGDIFGVCYSTIGKILKKYNRLFFNSEKI